MAEVTSSASSVDELFRVLLWALKSIAHFSNCCASIPKALTASLHNRNRAEQVEKLARICHHKITVSKLERFIGVYETDCLQQSLQATSLLGLTMRVPRFEVVARHEH